MNISAKELIHLMSIFGINTDDGEQGGESSSSSDPPKETTEGAKTEGS